MYIPRRVWGPTGGIRGESHHGSTPVSTDDES